MISMRLLSVVFVLALAACGGVGEEGTGPTSVNVGVLKGVQEDSFTVNDVQYARAGSTVTNGFGDALSHDDLHLGMWLEVTSAAGSDTDPGNAVAAPVAAEVRVLPAARGIIAAVDAAGFSLSMMGTRILYHDQATVLAGLDAFENLVAGDTVEVHGALGSDEGIVQASRLEKLAVDDSSAMPVVLRGRVTSLDRDARTMRVGGQAVSYAGAVVALDRMLANGRTVRVSALNGPPDRGSWSVARLVSDQLIPDRLSFLYVEGVVSEWQPGPTFMVEDLAIDASRANGRAAIVRNGQRVAVIGSYADGVLTAQSAVVVNPGQPVEFTLGGKVTGLAQDGTFRLRDVLVRTDAAQFVDVTRSELQEGHPVRVKGRIVGRHLIAERVQFLR